MKRLIFSVSLALYAASIGANDEQMKPQENYCAEALRSELQNLILKKAGLETQESMDFSQLQVPAGLNENFYRRYIAIKSKTQATTNSIGDNVNILHTLLNQNPAGMGFEEIAFIAKELRLDGIAPSATSRFVGKGFGASPQQSARDALVRMLGQLNRHPGTENLQLIYKWVGDRQKVDQALAANKKIINYKHSEGPRWQD